MLSILSELYAGDYGPLDRPYNPNTAYSKQFRKLSDMETALKSKLSDELKKDFTEYCNASADLAFLGAEEDFIEGFRLGVRLMIAALCPEPSAAE